MEETDGNPLPWLLVLFGIPAIILVICNCIGFHKEGKYFKEYTVGTPEYNKRIEDE